MRRILVDTSAYSLARRSHAAAQEAIQASDQIHMSPVVLGELRAGYLSGSRATANERELQDFLITPRVRIQPLDEETSRRYAILVSYLKKQGTLLATNDLWIAATALQHGLEIVSADADFERVPGLVLTRLEA